DSMANLTTMLTAVIGKTPLPPPVLQAAGQVLAASLPLGPALNGTALQKAVANSGLFQEAVLAQGAPELARGDLKTTLLTLRNTLVSWLGEPSTNPSAPASPLPPPVRGALPRSRPAGAPAVELPATPAEAGKVLLERTEGSLARLRLHQHASLPEATGTAAKPADWSMDLPVLIGSYQTVMQLQIHRDEAGSSQAASERGWQIRFAVDLPSLGEVGAQVGLRGGTTSVRLWANDPATASRFEQLAPELAGALAAAGLRPGVIMVRADEPAPQPPSTGHFVDSLS
ncbi:MAG: flagellar hook-length control protein FliK, partial [Cypionkella sp.]